MLITCESTPIWQCGMKRVKSWSQPAPKEEQSLCCYSESLQRHVDTFPNPCSYKIESENKSLVGIIVTEPRTILSRIKRCRRRKRVRFGDGEELSTRYPIQDCDDIQHNSEHAQRQTSHVKLTRKATTNMTNDELSELSRVHYRSKDYEIFRAEALAIATVARNEAYSEQQQQQQQTKISTEENTYSYNSVMTNTYQCAMYSTINIADRPLNKKNSKRKHRVPRHQNCCQATEQNVPYGSIEHKHCKEQQGDKINKRVTGCITHGYLTPHLFEALTHWVKVDNSRRGLEKFTVPYLTDIRQLSRKAVTEAVLAVQEMLSHAGDNCEEREEEIIIKNEEETEKVDQTSNALGWWRSDTSGLVKQIDMNDKDKEGYRRIQCLKSLGVPITAFSLSLSNEEIIRFVSEKYTRPSKLFAFTMGHADAAAL